MFATDGNMRQVYDGLSSENDRRVQYLNGRRDKDGPFSAEIADYVGRWHVITTQPGHENIAAGHLIGRGFGIYHPQFPVTIVRRGRKVDLMRNLIPGYLLVFVWGIERQQRRILACTGVTGILMTGEKAVVVSDEVIDRIRAHENGKRPLKAMMEVVKVRKRRKKREMVTVTEEKQVEPEDIVSVSSWSAFERPAAFDDGQRISAFRKALGLAS